MSMAAAKDMGVLIFNVEEGEKFFHLFRGPSPLTSLKIEQ